MGKLLTLLKPILTRQANGATCGSVDYFAKTIAAAKTAGCNYEQSGQTVGTDDYPHQYEDYEGFDFSVPSPWYEFPILDSFKVFNGDESPGPDRVIFNKNCW